jgi:cyclophilin family peptidyl-prolyl cis-trans isomerase
VLKLLDSKDAILAAAAVAAFGRAQDPAAVTALRRLLRLAAAQPEIIDDLTDAATKLKALAAEPELKLLLSAANAHVRLAAAASLTKLEGHPVRAPWVEGSPSADPLVPTHAVFRVRTARGDFDFAPFAESPLTVANFARLVGQGFYRGLTFHRVVPNFVIQGGDPRQDGNGGPGYVIPCEMNLHPYRRGVVGMALSGKDTGGSQFFVTLSAQPHLDGRYTAFGEVVRGEEVLDRILEGDLFDVQTAPQ